MWNVKKKSLVVFVVVVAVLGLSGLWLDSQGRLDIPRITNVPRVLTGDDESSFAPRGGRTPPTTMNTEAGGQASAAMRPGGFGEHSGEHSGEHGGTMAGLSVNNTLDVLSNVWCIGVIIASVVYVSKSLGRLKHSFRSRRVARVGSIV